MGRFAGLVVALGFGVAVLSGHGVARAEPPDSSSDSSSETSTNSPTASSANSPSESSASIDAQTTSGDPNTAASTDDSPNSPTAASTDSPSESSTSTDAQTTSDDPNTAVNTDDSPSSATPSTTPSNTEPTTSKDPTSLTAPATAPLLQPSGNSHSDNNVTTHRTANSAITSPAAASEPTAVPNVDDAELTAPTAQPPSVATAPLTATIGDVSLASVSAAGPTVQSTDSAQTAAAAVPAEPVELIAGVVSNLLGGLLDPSATGSAPETPPGEPAMWVLLASARREFETTPQTLVTDTPVAGVPVQVVENSLTYTPTPTIIDQLTLAALRVVRDITGFFGIPFAAIVGGLLSSENPPFFLTLGLNARKTEFEVWPGNVWNVWEFEPPKPTGATVVAIHGGGNIFQPNLLHWVDYTQMARQTGATVLVPLYPLARTEAGSILNVTPGMADYLSHVIDDRGAENVSIYADSAGSTYAFAAARELILRGEEVPASMVVISGQADYSQENDGAGIDDPFFNTVTVEYFARFHTFDGVVNADPRISPLRMETEVLRALPPTTMYVGNEEILLPGNLLLYERAVDIGAPISMVVGRGQFHNWPVSGLPVNSAAPKVRHDIYRQLGLLPDAVNAAINTAGVSANGTCSPLQSTAPVAGPSKFARTGRDYVFPCRARVQSAATQNR